MSPLATTIIAAFCLADGFGIGSACVGWIRDGQERAHCQGCIFGEDPDFPHPELSPAKASHLRVVGRGAGHDRRAS